MCQQTVYCLVDIRKDVEYVSATYACWHDAQADIVMVTDGEIAPPSDAVLQRLERAKADLGLEVHGLLVGRSDSSPAMDSICTHTHMFQSWNAVGSSRYD